MAKKAAPKTPATSAAKPAAKAVSSTAVRNSPVPRVTAPAAATKQPATYEMIQRRAYEISQSPECGSEFDNWVRAERELNTL